MIASNKLLTADQRWPVEHLPPLSYHCPFAGVGELNSKRNLTFCKSNELLVNDTNCLVTYVLIPDFDFEIVIKDWRRSEEPQML